MAANVNRNDVLKLIDQINSEIGAGTIMTDEARIKDVEFMGTGIAMLDAVTGGGIPRGRIIELFGIENSGKTTTTLEIIAACQRTFFKKWDRTGVCAFIDAEHALDPVWAKNIGVDMRSLLLTQPAHGEQVFTLIDKFARSGLVDLVVVDSVASVVPKAELDGDIEDNHIGAQARLMSKGLRAINGPVQKSQMAVIFINQIRHKVGVMFGSPETTPGGMALKFYASIRIDLRRGSAGKEPADLEARKKFSIVKAKIVKNKVAPPFQSCEYQIYFGEPPDGSDKPVFGVDKLGSLFDAAVKYGVIDQSSSHFSYGDHKLGNGRKNAIATLRLYDRKSIDAILASVVEQARPQNSVDLASVDDDALDEALEEDLSAPVGD